MPSSSHQHWSLRVFFSIWLREQRSRSMNSWQRFRFSSINDDIFSSREWIFLNKYLRSSWMASLNFCSISYGGRSQEYRPLGLIFWNLFVWIVWIVWKQNYLDCLKLKLWKFRFFFYKFNFFHRALWSKFVWEKQRTKKKISPKSTD